MALKTDILQVASDRIGKSVGDYLAGLAPFFTNIKTAFADGVNASNVLKDGGRLYNRLSYDERLLCEGFNLAPVLGGIVLDYRPATSNSTTSPNTASAMTQIFVPPTRCYVLNEISVASDKKTTINIEINDAFNSGKVLYLRKQLQPGQDVKFDLKGLKLHSNGRILITQYDSDGTAIVITGGISGIDITDDLNLTSDKNILFIGDSIQYGANLNATAQTYLPNAVYTTKIRDYYNDKGVNAEMVVMAVHAITTGGLERNRINGLYNSRKWDLIVYCAGTNNTIAGAAQSVIDTQLAAATLDYQNFVKWKKNMQTQAKLLMLGPTPMFNATREAQLVGLRTAMQNTVQTLGDSKTKYLSLGTAYTATVQGNYSEAAGTDGVHPNVASNALMFNVVKPFLDEQFPLI